MNNTVELNGLLWDTENLSVNDKTHFTYEEAKAEAAKLGKRLPTKNEFEELLKLPHVFDEEKHGVWFAKNQEDLKSDKSLFLTAYRLNSNKTNNGSMCMIDGKYMYTIRCVSDIKQEEEKSIKVQIPEGYEIDKEKSTFTNIVFKPIVSKYPKYPKSWEDAFVGNPICGYWIETHSEIKEADVNASFVDKNVFKTEKQVKSALAYAQLTQLMALPCYNGDWKPNWSSFNNEKKYVIIFYNNRYDIEFTYVRHYFLAFQSERKAKIFLKLYKDLIDVFFQNK